MFTPVFLSLFFTQINLYTILKNIHAFIFDRDFFIVYFI